MTRSNPPSPFADLLKVAPGYEAAIAAALGHAADAVAVDSIGDASAGLAHLKAEDAGPRRFRRGRRGRQRLTAGVETPEGVHAAVHTRRGAGDARGGG